MIKEVQSLLDQYWIWLKDQTNLHQVGDWVEITTPYLDRHNDHIQIYVKQTNDEFTLTDGGYTIEDLELSGCEIDNAKRNTLFKMMLSGFGVQMNGKALEVKTSKYNFAMQKHNLIQAMLAVNDLFYLTFYEDVVAHPDPSDIQHMSDVKFIEWRSTTSWASITHREGPERPSSEPAQSTWL